VTNDAGNPAASGMRDDSLSLIGLTESDCIVFAPREEFGSTLRVSLERWVLDVVSPERTFTGIGAHFYVTSAIMSFGMACLTG
jgi:hypothetical protein